MNQEHIDTAKRLWTATGLKPVQGFFIVFGALALIGSAPSFLKHQARIDADKAELQRISAERRILKRQFEAETEQAEIANKRYSTCLPVVGKEFKNNTHYFSGIKVGEVIKDRITGNPLPKGTVICDAHGSTGVIDEKGKVRHIAFTGNRDVIKSRLKRFRGSQYSQPVVSDSSK